MIKHILFAFAVLAQLAIIAAGPAEKMVVRQTGKEIRIRTVPVDPYDAFRGYYIDLNYEISSPPEYVFEKHADHASKLIYTILERGEDGVWNSVGWKHKFPTETAEGQIVIRGRETGDRWQPIKYGIEKYFLPEERRHEIEAKVQRTWQTEGNVVGERRRGILVDVAVDKQGRSSILRLIIDDAVYEY